MSRDLIHQLVGYDGGTQSLVFECAIPSSKLAEVFRIAGVEDEDPDAIDAYALDEVQSREISGLLNVTLPQSDLLYYLESCLPVSLPHSLRSRSA